MEEIIGFLSCEEELIDCFESESDEVLTCRFQSDREQLNAGEEKKEKRKKNEENPDKNSEGQSIRQIVPDKDVNAGTVGTFSVPRLKKIEKKKNILAMTMNLNVYFLGASLAIVLLSSAVVAAPTLPAGTFDIRKYGAIGDGKTDCTKAVQQSWTEACQAEGMPQILIPAGNYLVGPLHFKGPCKGEITMQLTGNLLAQPNYQIFDANWIDFRYVNGLTINGGGKIDGQGANAWPNNNCPKKWECKTMPMNLVLSFVNNASISGISSVNSKFFHMQIFNVNNLTISNIKIEAPGESPNTDGIHVAGSSNVNILDSAIGTGDDCVSVGDKTNNLTVQGVTCGPGHGISVGSLGKNPGEEDVIGFTVKNCTLTGTSNGVRIKTWKSKPSTASTNMKLTDFTFEDIIMNNVSNPIVIDQEYCPYAACPESDPSRIKISHVAFRNIRGTYGSDDSIKFRCSSALPCEGIELKDIDLEYIGTRAEQHDAAVSNSCLNVKGLTKANVKPDICNV